MLSGEWSKSTFSNGSGGNNCVEVTLNPAIPGKVFLRSSRDRTGPVVSFTEDEWVAFLAGVNAGEFDLPTMRYDC